MKLIEKNILPTIFLESINQNLSELATIRGVSEYPEITLSDNYINAINSAYGSDIIIAGMRGSEVITTINNELINVSGGVIDPMLNSVTWLDDGVTLDILDGNSGVVEYEVWENRNEEDFELHELVSDKNQHCKIWQNCIAGVKVRSKKNGNYSGFSEAVYIETPLVIYTDQTTLNEVFIKEIRIRGLVEPRTLDWGDGNLLTLNASDVILDLTKNYTESGVYYIKIYARFITQIQIFDTTWGEGTDVTKWNFNKGFEYAHFYNNGYTGDITKLKYPSTCKGLHLGGNGLSGNITNHVLPPVYWDVHYNGNLTGVITDWVLPNTVAHFEVRGYIEGDLTDVIPFVASEYGSILVRLESTHPNGFTGNLNGWIIPDYMSLPTSISCSSGCNFTGLPRGNFNTVELFDFSNNNCNTTEVDDFLVYVDNYFTEEVVPLYSSVYRLTGVNMGIPTVTGLSAKSSIESKYIAEGLTCVIYVNE